MSLAAESRLTNVLRNTETKVARRGKVALVELVLLHLETALNNIHRLGAAHGHVGRDGFVSSDGELADSVAGAAKARLLTRKLLQNTRRERETIATLTRRNVQDQLVHDDVAHRVLELSLRL